MLAAANIGTSTISATVKMARQLKLPSAAVYGSSTACEWINGRKEWYLNGECMTEEQHRQQTQSCTGKVVEIDGKKYKLTEV